MVVTNHKLLNLRFISIVTSFCFAITVYVNVKGIFMFPLSMLQVGTLLLAVKLKYRNKERSLRIVSRGALIFLMVLYGLAIALGVVVSMTASGAANTITLLLFYVVCLDALLAIPFTLSFTDRSKWQHVAPASGFVAGSSLHDANGQMVTAFADSDYSATDRDMYWSQNDYHTNSAFDSSPSVNPASGLPMVNDVMDVGGNVYGFGEPTFSNDSFNTNQFSDFDYHNNQ